MYFRFTSTMFSNWISRTHSLDSLKSFSVVLLVCNDPLLSAKRCSRNTLFSTLMPSGRFAGTFSRVMVPSRLLVSKELSPGFLDCGPLTKKITIRTAVMMEMTATVTTTIIIIWVWRSRHGFVLQACVWSVVLHDSQVLFLIRTPSLHDLEQVLHFDHSPGWSEATNNKLQARKNSNNIPLTWSIVKIKKD